MAPSRRKDIAVVALRAMIAGNVACFITACIAGGSHMHVHYSTLIRLYSILGETYQAQKASSLKYRLNSPRNV